MIRKVGAAILSNDGRLLVVRKRGRDIFILPGGQPENDETVEQTLNRELEEELGARAAEMQPLMTVVDTSAFEDVPLHMEVFSVVLDGIPHPNREIVEIAFVSPDWKSSGLRLASGVTQHVLPRLFPDTASRSRRTKSKDLRPVAVLFSGGRDSTAVAAHFYELGRPLHLLSFRSGLGNDSGLYALRVAELSRLWDKGTFEMRELPITGLVRQICFHDLVDDILDDKRQLILLGEALAMIVRSIEYCLKTGITDIAVGATAYQSHFPEQQPGALRRFAKLCHENGLTLLTPGVQWQSENDVKNKLRLAGLSTKSLEASTILSDLDDNPPPKVVIRYLDRKLPWAHEYLKAQYREPESGAEAWG